MPKSRLIIIGIGGFVGLLLLLVFLGVIPGLKQPGSKQGSVNLTVWGVFDRPDIISGVLSSVPGYKVTYREMNPRTYEEDLINALAAGKGPDIFMVHNTWVPKHFDKLAPLNIGQLKIGGLRQVFPTVVEQDFNADGELAYALPLYIDTLALFYNQNIFDTKGIALPPKTWAEFQDLIPKLREIDASGKIIKAAAAIGGSNKNINRATDLLNVLFLQSGNSMVNQRSLSANFSQDGDGTLAFYTKFANPSSELYTWNDSLKDSLDSFAEENTAMIFSYLHQLPVLKNKNPFLEIGIAPLPQPSNAQIEVNYANYWGLGVSNQFSNPIAAWNFIWLITTDPARAKTYAEASERLPALRTLIAERLDHPFWGIFAKQALSARSWPQIDNIAVQDAFSKMIDDVIGGRSDIGGALEEAQTTINNLMERKSRQ